MADSYQHILVTYDHAGKKLRKQVQGASGVLYSQDYADGLEYRTNGSGGSLTLEAIYHTEGRITPLSAGAYRYEYTIKDHLGNARLSFADLNGNKIVDVPEEIVQENHYYPFGLNANYSWMNNTTLLDNRYQYNGKELNDDFGLNWNDYGARWYDAAVGRWWSVDPMGEKYVRWSPYNYTFNNPIKYADPDGMDAILVIKPGENGANGTIIVALTFNYDNKEGSSFVESAVSSFQNTWGNGGYSNAGNIYQGNSFNDIEVDGQKYNVTYQLILNGTDDVSGSTREGTNSLKVITGEEGSNYSQGNMEYRASQEKTNNNTSFGHELSHAMGIGHNEYLTDETGKTSISAGATTNRGVIRQDVVNSVQGSVKVANNNTSRSVVTLTTDRGGSGQNTVNVKQQGTTIQSGQYPVIENTKREK